MARKQQVVDQLFKGLAGLAQEPQDHRVRRHRHARAPTRTVTVTGADGQVTELTGTDVVLASGSVPRTIPGFDVDGKLRPHLRRGLRARSPARAGSW